MEIITNLFDRFGFKKEPAYVLTPVDIDRYARLNALIDYTREDLISENHRHQYGWLDASGNLTDKGRFQFGFFKLEEIAEKRNCSVPKLPLRILNRVMQERGFSNFNDGWEAYNPTIK